MTHTQLENLGLTLQAHVRRAEMCPAQVRMMSAALDRIAAGTYGRCARCYGEIGMVRLTALPHAVFCIPCQEITFRHRDSGNGRLTVRTRYPQI